MRLHASEHSEKFSLRSRVYTRMRVRTYGCRESMHIYRPAKSVGSFLRETGKHARRYNTECIHLAASLPDTYIVGNRWEITSLLLFLFTLQAVAYFSRVTISP